MDILDKTDEQTLRGARLVIAIVVLFVLAGVAGASTPTSETTWAELRPSEAFRRETISSLTATSAPVTIDRLTSTTLLLNGQDFEPPELQFALADYIRAMPSSDARTTETRLNFRLNLALTRFAADFADREGALADADFRRQEAYLRARHAAEYYIRSRVLSGVTVSEADIAAYYEGHAAQFSQPEMITIQLILTPSADDARAAQEALAGGADFATVAEKYSEHVSRLKGGLLAAIPRGTLDEALEERVFALADGELSEIIETSNGWYLVQRMSTQPAKVRALSEARGEIYDHLSLERRRQALDGFYRKLLDGTELDLLAPIPAPAPPVVPPAAPSEEPAPEPAETPAP